MYRSRGTTIRFSVRLIAALGGTPRKGDSARRHGGDDDTRKVDESVHDDKSRLPAWREVPIEGQQVSSWSPSSRLRTNNAARAIRRHPVRFASRSRRRAAGEKFKEKNAKPFARAQSTAATMRKALKPLGASTSRGIVESDNDELAGQTGDLEKPEIDPSGARPITKIASSPSSRNSSSSSMTNPFRVPPASQFVSSSSSSALTGANNEPALQISTR